MNVAVIGLGRFGFRLAVELKQRGLDVIALDRDPRRVAEFEDEVEDGHAVVLDATDLQSLDEADLGKLDLAVVCIGEAVEQSQLVTYLLKTRLAVPRVIARAHTDTRQAILERLQADEVVRPESESAVRLAQRLSFRGCQDFLELAPGVAMVRLTAPGRFWGKTILDLEVRPRFRVNIVGIRPAPSPEVTAEVAAAEEEKPIIAEDDPAIVEDPVVSPAPEIELLPEPAYEFREGDELFVVGHETDIRRLIVG